MSSDYTALMQVIKNMQGTNEMLGKRSEEQGTPGITLTQVTGPEGSTWNAEGDHKDLKIIMDTLGNYSKIVQAYSKEADRLTAQQQHMNPIINALATVGGNLATADPRLPPVVRALGQSSKDLNPTYQQLEDRKLGVLKGLGETLHEAGQLETFSLAQQREARLQHSSDARLELDRQLAQLKAKTEEDRVKSDERKAKLQDKHFDTQMEIARMQESGKDVRQLRALQMGLEKQIAHEDWLSQENEKKSEQQMARLERSLKGKDSKINTLDQGQLEGISTTRDEITNMKAVMTDNPDMMGYTEGNPISKWWNTRYGDKTFQEFESNKKTLQAAVTQAFGEKTRGFTKAGLDYNMGLIPQMSDTRAQAMSKLGELERNLQARFDSVAKNNKDADLSAWGQSSTQMNAVVKEAEQYFKDHPGAQEITDDASGRKFRPKKGGGVEEVQ